ncbi:hypothetical protein MFIFM68171_09707 [Madurella fahalii]|uniref:Kinesin light chain n=1 Tax=Madurella fahalii TaxID=1157608 RepID=A0ABQ0GP39_9PEZI
MESISFGPENQGQQVGYNYGTINATFHSLPETPPKPFATIPFPRDLDFVNRGDILDQIDKQCSRPAGRVALVGLGGVGKSQLAIEYAHRIAEQQPDKWVFWIHAGTQARVDEGFRTIADAVKLPGRNQPKADIPQLVYYWLSNERNGRWIMILDSADDGDVFYNANSSHGLTPGDARDKRPFATYLPQSRNGSIIVTTRNRDLAFRLTGHRQNMIDVGPMAQADALTLLEKKLGSLGSPASLDVAADLISFDHIRTKRRTAADLLSLMSFFDRQGIPGWILKPSGVAKDTMREKGPDEAGGGESDDSGSTTDDDTNNDADDVIDGGFEDDVAILRDYCLILVDETGDEFEMHGLVQLSTRRWLEALGQQEAFKQQCIKRMAASFPTGKYENWATCRSLFAHVQVALGYRPSKARKVREKRLGKEDVATLASIAMFANILWSQGWWEEAEKLFVQVMETRKTKLGADHPDTLMSMHDLAYTWEDQGRRADALALMEDCAKARRRVLGEEHPYTLLSLTAVAEWSN